MGTQRTLEKRKTKGHHDYNSVVDASKTQGLGCDVNKTPPVLQALVLADHIYTDGATGKRIICGTFSKIFSSKFPNVTTFPAFVFVLLVDVIGEVVLQLRFVSLDDNEILMESPPMRIRSESPLTPLDLVVQIPPFPLPRAGIYSFECWTDETMIGSVRLQVAKQTREEDPNE